MKKKHLKNNRYLIKKFLIGEKGVEGNKNRMKCVFQHIEKNRSIRTIYNINVFFFQMINFKLELEKVFIFHFYVYILFHIDQK